MKKYVCQYTIIRFLPYVETEEFANIGILMAAVNQPYFGFELIPSKHHGRITHFFDQLDAFAFRETVKVLKGELERIKENIDFQTPNTSCYQEVARNIFDNIVTNKETIVRYSEPRVLVTNNPVTELKALYRRFVERDFATKQRNEVVFEEGIKEILQINNLNRFFKHEIVGDKRFKVRFPFVKKMDGEPSKIIKPLFLGHAEPTKVREHGGTWWQKFVQLQDLNLLPEKVLVPYIAPNQYSDSYDACASIIEKIRKLDIDVVPEGEVNRILEFATD